MLNASVLLFLQIDEGLVLDRFRAVFGENR